MTAWNNPKHWGIDSVHVLEMVVKCQLPDAHFAGTCNGSFVERDKRLITFSDGSSLEGVISDGRWFVYGCDGVTLLFAYDFPVTGLATRFNETHRCAGNDTHAFVDGLTG